MNREHSNVISARIDELRTDPDPAVRSHGYRLWNRRFHHAIGAMAQSRVMTETSQRMWDLSDFLINTTDVPQPSARRSTIIMPIRSASAPHCMRVTRQQHAGRWSATSSPPRRS
ncbi:MAG TPA: hypothetical protein VHR39_18535, partial [Propionibacteriaceae bacterium]|nr:hypothetical protein [Propionibacteriaceae bacterium]